MLNLLVGIVVSMIDPIALVLGIIGGVLFQTGRAPFAWMVLAFGVASLIFISAQGGAQQVFFGVIEIAAMAIDCALAYAFFHWRGLPRRLAD